MLSEYQEKVLATYKQMCEAGGPSLILSKPTTAKLKKECLRIYDKRYTPEDDDILSTFFNVDKIGIDFRRIIAKATPGTFRALWNHLNDDSINTNERNSELLAWLIDFTPRPSFRYYQAIREGNKEEDKPVAEENPDGNSTNNTQADSNKTDSDSTAEEHKIETSNSDTSQETPDKPNSAPTIPVVLVINTSESKASEGPEEVTNKEVALTTEQEKETDTLKTSETDDKTSRPDSPIPPKPPLPFKLSKAIITVLLIALLGFSLYSYLNYGADMVYLPATTQEKCMHWTGNRYEPIACDAQTSTTAIIGIDFQRLNHFKKINIPDKLTKYDLGKVWYAKIYGKVEFYTDSGMHPVETDRRLKPLTEYMLSKYVSYYRYLFTSSIWILGIVVFSAFLAILSFKYLPKRHKRVGA